MRAHLRRIETDQARQVGHGDTGDFLGRHHRDSVRRSAVYDGAEFTVIDAAASGRDGDDAEPVGFRLGGQFGMVEDLQLDQPAAEQQHRENHRDDGDPLPTGQ